MTAQESDRPKVPSITKIDGLDWEKVSKMALSFVRGGPPHLKYHFKFLVGMLKEKPIVAGFQDLSPAPPK